MQTGLDLMKELSITSPAKIVLLVIDGLGGLPRDSSGETELETANTTNMNKLASLGNCGLIQTVGTGITPGSAPGHLGLFGYDPLVFTIGRGVLEALGMDFDLAPGDISARGNFCTLDDNGMISDRRAGRISTEVGKQLCGLLDGMERHVGGVEPFPDVALHHRQGVNRAVKLLIGVGVLQHRCRPFHRRVSSIPARRVPSSTISAFRKHPSTGGV